MRIITNQIWKLDLVFHLAVAVLQDEIGEFLGGILSQTVSLSNDGTDIDGDVKKRRKRKVSVDSPGGAGRVSHNVGNTLRLGQNYSRPTDILKCIFTRKILCFDSNFPKFVREGLIFKNVQICLGNGLVTIDLTHTCVTTDKVSEC